MHPAFSPGAFAVSFGNERAWRENGAEMVTEDLWQGLKSRQIQLGGYMELRAALARAGWAETISAAIGKPRWLCFGQPRAVNYWTFRRALWMLRAFWTWPKTGRCATSIFGLSQDSSSCVFRERRYCTTAGSEDSQEKSVQCRTRSTSAEHFGVRSYAIGLLTNNLSSP